MPTRSARTDIYRGQNPVDVPAYTLHEVAHCLQVPLATIRAWSLGRNYSCSSGDRWAAPLIQIADGRTPALSFRNTIELHILSAIRRKHQVRMVSIRSALDYLRRESGLEHPLSDQQMTTDGTDLFIEEYGRLVNISRGGQLEMKSLVGVYLSRVERDKWGGPIRFFPFTTTRFESAPRLVVMNPLVQFGRACIAGTGIPTSIIAERYKAGDSIQQLAADYGQTTGNIEEAVRFEFETTAA